MKNNNCIYALMVCCVVFLSFTMTAQTVTKLSNDQFKFLEGPVWDGAESLYFTDITGNSIIKYTDDGITKTFTPILTESNRANGLMFNAKNNLVVCEGSEGRVTERNTSGDLIKPIIEQYNNVRFNSPNDLVIDSKGGIYFTDPNFGDSSNQFQTKNRVYYLSSEGTLTMLIDDLQKPNGVILSTDGKTLYVNDTFSTIVLAYDVKDDGLLENGRTFTTLDDGGNPANTGADGMAIDVDDNLYVTSAAGVQVFDKEGTALPIINVPEKSTNCTFGGADMKTLFITAGTNLYSTTIITKGFRHPFDLPGFSLATPDFGSSSTKKKLQISPNPVTNNMGVLSEIPSGNAELSLYTLEGKLISSSLYNLDQQGRVDFNAGLAKGMYLLRAVNGKSTGVLSFMLQ